LQSMKDVGKEQEQLVETLLQKVKDSREREITLNEAHFDEVLAKSHMVRLYQGKINPPYMY
jgi:hypothetical protein